MELLQKSPFVKFMPDTIIRCQGFMEGSGRFITEWKTDKIGFKNSDEVANKERVEIVALGDSFTECTGVALGQAWPSILSVNGFLTYNLGVQGYAPIQLEGSLREYGMRFHPQYIIIGYLEGMYDRETFFLNQRSVLRHKRFTGGIQAIIDAQLKSENIREIKEQGRHFVSALYLLAYREMVYKTYTYLKDKRVPAIAIKNLQLYSAEMAFVGVDSYLVRGIEENSAQWRNTLTTLSNIVRMARAINAKVILLYFPMRSEMYFQKATGKDLPDRCLGKIEAGLLEKFAYDNQITFLNLGERIRNYVNSLPDDSSLDRYPYFTNDAHLNNWGCALVAEEILGYLRKAKEN